MMSFDLGSEQLASEFVDEADACENSGVLPPYPGSPRFNQLPPLSGPEVSLIVNLPNHGLNQPEEEELVLPVPDLGVNQAEEEQDYPVRRHPTGIYPDSYWEVYEGNTYMPEVTSVYERDGSEDEEEMEDSEDDEEMQDSESFELPSQPAVATDTPGKLNLSASVDRSALVDSRLLNDIVNLDQPDHIATMSVMDAPVRDTVDSLSFGSTLERPYSP